MVHQINRQALFHHDLSAAIDPQPALETIRGKRGVPLFCEFCLETVGRVVEAGVQYAAVASAGVQTAFGLFFQQRYARVAVPPLPFPRDAQAHYPSTHHQKIRRVHW